MHTVSAYCHNRFLFVSALAGAGLCFPLRLVLGLGTSADHQAVVAALPSSPDPPWPRLRQ